MNYLKSILFLILIFFLSYVNTSAEPSRSMQYLMHEPVTLFDLGMLKLQDSLDEKDVYLPNGYKMGLRSSYESRENIIEIRVTVGGIDKDKYAKDKEEAKEWCKEVLNSTRFSFGIDSTGKLLFDIFQAYLRDQGLETGTIADYFKHADNSFGVNRPDGIGEEIDRITKVLAIIPIKNKNVFKCEGPLISNKILFEE